MKKIAIIPARGGSKRIPRKNIRLFNGKPILNYSISNALQTNLFDEVMVSTDDQEIADVAINAGAVVPFMRGEEISGDYSGIAEVLIDVVERYKEELAVQFDYICCVLPTAPLLKAQNISKAFDKMRDKGASAIMSVVCYSYPIQRSLAVEDGYVAMNWPQNYFMRSQDLEPMYHDAAQFYWIKTVELIKNKKLFIENLLGYELPESEVQDIDTENDWLLAEMKYNFLNDSE